jgi:hypothetical protein
MQKLDLKISESSVFKTLGQQGLITFSDYMFLTTLLLSKFCEEKFKACIFAFYRDRKENPSSNIHKKLNGQ